MLVPRRLIYEKENYRPGRDPHNAPLAPFFPRPIAYNSDLVWTIIRCRERSPRLGSLLPAGSQGWCHARM